MALTLIKEDGTGRRTRTATRTWRTATRITRGTVCDGVDGGDGGRKAAALVMATRLIDAQYQFTGIARTASRRCSGRVRSAGTLTRAW